MRFGCISMVFVGLFTMLLGYNPAAWALTTGIGGLLLANINGQQFWKSMVVVCACGAHTTEIIEDLYNSCHTDDGSEVDTGTCAISVTKSIFGVGLSVGSYQTTRQWGKREDSDSTTLLIIEERIPLGTLLSFCQYGEDSVCNYTHVAHSALEAVMNNTGKVYDATAILKTEESVIVGLVAINGTYSVTPMKLSAHTKRDGFNGYDTTAPYWIDVLCNLDPVSDWNDALNWAATGDDAGITPDAKIWGYEKDVGVSSSACITDTYGIAYAAGSGSTDGRNAQFIAKIVGTGLFIYSLALNIPKNNIILMNKAHCGFME